MGDVVSKATGIAGSVDARARAGVPARGGPGPGAGREGPSGPSGPPRDPGLRLRCPGSDVGIAFSRLKPLFNLGKFGAPGNSFRPLLPPTCRCAFCVSHFGRECHWPPSDLSFRPRRRPPDVNWSVLPAEGLLATHRFYEVIMRQKAGSS